MLSVLFIVGLIWLFAAIGFALNYVSLRVSPLPLVFYVAGITGFLDLNELAPIIVEEIDGLTVVVTADVFVPVLLALILVVYINNGTRLAQLLVIGIIAVGGVTLTMIGALAVLIEVLDADALSGTLVESNNVTLHTFRRILVGRFAFLFDMLMIAIVYQGIHNALPGVNASARIGLALLIAFWTDAVTYNILAESGTSTFGEQLVSDLRVKSFAAAVLWPPTAYYVTRIAATARLTLAAEEHRPTLDMLNDPFLNIREVLRRTQQELAESRHIYEKLTEQIDEIFWLAYTTGDRPVHYVSPSFSRIFGLSQETAIYDTPQLLKRIHPDDRERFRNGLFAYWMQYPTDEFRLQHEDGRVRWVRSRVFPIRGDNGEISRYGGLLEDITDQRAAEERKLTLALERERVHLLQNFIRDTSHDLRTPISAILMRAHLLRRVEDPAMRDKYLDQLVERSEYLTRLIDNLFTLSRIESRTPETSQRVQLNQVLKGVAESVRPKIDQKKLDLFMQLDDDVPPFIANPYDLERAFSNLVENALRYTELGSITLRTVWNAAASTVTVMVTDTGIGIELDEQARIFDRFFRARTAQDLRVQGTGLGLAIVKSVVDRYSGTITVTSTPGTGTTFTLVLPVPAPRE